MTHRARRHAAASSGGLTPAIALRALLALLALPVAVSLVIAVGVSLDRPAGGAVDSAATASTGSGGARLASDAHGPVVVQRRVVAVPGLNGKTPGPRNVTVRFPHPTTKGDLLVAGVDDGVEQSGMVHARYRFPHWRRAVETIGGQRATTRGAATGGLQAAIYFYPDNPGGLVSVPVASIPPGSLDWVSVVLVELADTPPATAVDTTGTSTNGPLPSDYSLVSTVRTRRATAVPDELVLAVFNNGDNSPHGVGFVNSPGWTIVGEVHDPNNNEQPILLDFRVARRPTVVTETDHYVGGYPIDNCAVIAALR